MTAHEQRPGHADLRGGLRAGGRDARCRRLRSWPDRSRRIRTRAAARSQLAQGLPHPHYRHFATEFVDRWSQVGPQVTPQAVALALLTAGQAEQAPPKNQSVELVWTGPEAEAVPFRRTEQAILQVLDSARQRITLVELRRLPDPATSAEALVRAAGRGVRST